jgi:D-alanyl-D-alanine carboxypeptidase
VGLVVHDPTHGKQLLNLNGSDAFVPASTTKLFTVAAALAAIDPTTRFRTMVVSAGGSRRIVLTGGGDPLLARRTPPAGPTVDGYPQPATLARLAAATARALDRRGVSSVRVGLDAALFAGPAASPAWEPDYLYNVVSPITALWVDGGRAAGSSERSRDPVLAAGAAFEAQLQRHGISVRGQPSAASAPANGQTLAFVESPPMAQIAEHILATSDNEAAEVLLRHVALASGRPASFTGGVTAVRQVLSRLGLELSRVRLYDGSGLSRHNRVPLRTLADLLDLATRQQELRPLLTGLPVAGFSGSLGYRFSADGTDAAAASSGPRPAPCPTSRCSRARSAPPAAPLSRSRWQRTGCASQTPRRPARRWTGSRAPSQPATAAEAHAGRRRRERHRTGPYGGRMTRPGQLLAAGNATDGRAADDMVDWDLAVQTARRMMKPGPQVSRHKPEKPSRSCAVAPPRPRLTSGGIPGCRRRRRPHPSSSWTARWVQANADGLRVVLRPLAAKMRSVRSPGGIANAVGPRSPGGRRHPARLSGQQGAWTVRPVLARAATLDPRGRRRAAAAGRPQHRPGRAGPRRRSTEFRLWVCLHEETHRVQFTAVPWLTGHIHARSPAVGRDRDRPGKFAAMLREGAGNLLDLVRGKSEQSLPTSSRRPSSARSSTGSPL